MFGTLVFEIDHVLQLFLLNFNPKTQFQTQYFELSWNIDSNKLIMINQK